jgi:hypothetical protein
MSNYIRRKEKVHKPQVERLARAEWLTTPATVISGNAYLTEVNQLTNKLNDFWGVDLLRLIVSPDLRERFDKRRFHLNQAIYSGDLDQLKSECGLMIKALNALDRAAKEAGARPISPQVWEASTPSGQVVAICKTAAEATAYRASGRDAVVWTLDEIASCIDSQILIQNIKRAFPGAEVVHTRREEIDPIRAFDEHANMNDEIPF